jgi:hypothetical protein
MKKSKAPEQSNAPVGEKDLGWVQGGDVGTVIWTRSDPPPPDSTGGT